MCLSAVSACKGNLLWIVVIYLGILHETNSLPTLGNSTLIGITRVARQSSKCGFRCSDGNCISRYAVCDGQANCADKSDESIAECALNSCQPLSFRCAYGACVDGDSKCNGVQDCADGSDEKLPECQGGTVSSGNKCGSGKFTCDDGNCIKQYSLCDGTVDCTDSSDETSKACRDMKCTSESFQCSYGACVNGDATCNGHNDCADGSDESKVLCPGSTVVPPRPNVAGGCVLPKKPDHGKYSSSVGNSVPGDVVPNFTVLDFTCAKGYSLTKKASVICRNGNWSTSIPQCAKTCPPRVSSSLDITCTLNGVKQSCDKPMLPRTKATFKCKESYEISSILAYSSSICDDGLWDVPLYQCFPVCGTKVPEGQQLVVGGNKTKLGEFPWHVGLFKSIGEDDYVQICGGSIINPKVVITAAHCFLKLYDPEIYAIAASVYYRTWKHPLDVTGQYAKAEKILYPERYQGPESSYSSDIAIVVVQKPFVLSNILRPVCMDWSETNNDATLRVGDIGHVAGWGLTEEGGDSSEELKTIALPYIPYSDCFDKSPVSFRPFISEDKFCAGYLTGMGVCEGDSGGGLTFVSKDRHFLRGIVSVSPTKAGSCDTQRYTAFTRISNHIRWIGENEVENRPR